MGGGEAQGSMRRGYDGASLNKCGRVAIRLSAKMCNRLWWVCMSASHRLMSGYSNIRRVSSHANSSSAASGQFLLATKMVMFCCGSKACRLLSCTYM